MKLLSFRTESGMWSSAPPIDAWSAAPGMFTARPQYGASKSGLLQVGYMGDFEIPVPRLWTPSAIKSYLKQISTELQALAREVSAARKQHGAKVVTDDELASFKEFYNEVRTWLDSNPSTWWGANVTRGQDYQARMIAWRTMLTHKGMQLSSPGPSSPSRHKLDVPTPNAGTKLVLALCAVAAGAAAVGYAASKVRPSQPTSEKA